MPISRTESPARQDRWALDDARAAVSGASCWVLTDGKVGDEANCLGVTERLGLAAEVRRVAPSRFWAAFMPWGPAPPSERPFEAGSPIAPPFPDIVVASGRRAVPYLRALRKAAGVSTFTAFMKEPKTGAGAADFIWLPAHDRLRGPNVLATLLSPHRLSPERLAGALESAPPGLAALARPRLVAILGGRSKDLDFNDADAARLVAALDAFAAAGFSLAGSVSRRTPRLLAEAVGAAMARHRGWFWRGEGANPYPSLLAGADRLLVTADSVNMVGEALAVGVPVHVFQPGARSAKIDRFLRALLDQKAVRLWNGDLAGWTAAPLDSTPEIAIALAHHYMTFRASTAARSTAAREFHAAHP